MKHNALQRMIRLFQSTQKHLQTHDVQSRAYVGTIVELGLAYSISFNTLPMAMVLPVVEEGNGSTQTLYWGKFVRRERIALTFISQCESCHLRKLLECFQANHTSCLEPSNHYLVLLDKPADTITSTSALTHTHTVIHTEVSVLLFSQSFCRSMLWVAGR